MIRSPLIADSMISKESMTANSREFSSRRIYRPILHIQLERNLKLWLFKIDLQKLSYMGLVEVLGKQRMFKGLAKVLWGQLPNKGKWIYLQIKSTKSGGQ